MTKLLDVRKISKTFEVGRGFLGSQKAKLKALHEVSFHVDEGEAFGIVGESGCGKSTAGRSILRLIEPDTGVVIYNGQDLISFDRRKMRAMRKEVQMIFQDPYASLNPRMTIYRALSEAMLFHGVSTKATVREDISAILKEVGMPPEAMDKFPHEFSGGQRQRIGIARALVLNPSLIVADEPVSALDVSIQAQILQLMSRLQKSRKLSFVFISHDLGVVRYFCQRVAVMYLGRVVETGPVQELFDDPLHPYSRALREASPVPDPRTKISVARIKGDVASPLSPPTGCHFHPRCPRAMDICRKVYPEWRQVTEARGTACHLHDPEIGDKGE